MRGVQRERETRAFKGEGTSSLIGKERGYPPPGAEDKRKGV